MAGYTDKSVAHLFKAIEIDPESYKANLYLGMGFSPLAAGY